jgi:hypothetical protein
VGLLPRRYTLPKVCRVDRRAKISKMDGGISMDVIKESIDKLNRALDRMYELTEEPIRIDDICEELDDISEIVNSAKVSLMLLNESKVSDELK